MKKSMCITYIVEDKLYVNITNKCSNRCDFCIRNNGDGAYGSDSLWLEREPTVDEILDSVFSHDLNSFPELVFCGYGEPTYRLDDAVLVAREVKNKYPSIKVRINTNGQSDLILGRETAPEYKGAFDIVSISLNSPTAEGYQSICHSIYGERAFDALVDFAGRVKAFVPVVQLSAVKETLNSDEIELCKKIASELGVTLRLRDYIPPET
jgi:TatD family-associated radical SAM protein